MHVTIEHAKGTKRELYDDKGNLVYSKHMYHPYGYFTGTEGRDGDDVDCFLGPLTNAKEVYVIHMKDLGPDKNEREDEDKVMLGFPSADAAKAAFHLHYLQSFFGGMSVLPLSDFKKKLKATTLPYGRKKITAASRLLVLALMVVMSAFPIEFTTITGMFKNPDGTAVNGKITIQLERNGAVTNTCVTPAQVISFTTITRTITSSLMAPLQLYPTSCLSPRQYYVVYLYNQNGTQLYRGLWNVPTTSPADVTTISYVNP
jgi:hypothetical protein